MVITGSGQDSSKIAPETLPEIPRRICWCDKNNRKAFDIVPQTFFEIKFQTYCNQVDLCYLYGGQKFISCCVWQFLLECPKLHLYIPFGWFQTLFPWILKNLLKLVILSQQYSFQGFSSLFYAFLSILTKNTLTSCWKRFFVDKI